MFHVSSMLPHAPNDPQNIERKRHLGNDIVMILFQESDEPFQLNTITSKQNHIVVVVKPGENDFKYLTLLYFTD